MNARFASVLLPALVLFVALSGCARKDPAKFARANLTAEDRAAFAGQSEGDSATQKFGWPLEREHHVRVLLDRSDDGGATWKREKAIPYHLPLVHATLLVHFQQPRPVVRDANGLGKAYLMLRLGGRGISTNGWSGSTLLLAFPGDRVDWTTPEPPQPDLVLQLKSADTIYRLRLEAQEKPWANS